MIKPLGDRVVIRVLEQEEKTASGIFLPDTAKEKPSQGEVIAVGTGKLQDNGTRTPLEVSVGDKIIFSNGSKKSPKIHIISYFMFSAYLINCC